MKALKMPLRMPARLLVSAGAVALAASLSSCGFDYATDRIYTVTAGTTNRDAAVDVLSAVVVSGQQGSGTLITSFSNNDPNKSATVTGVSGAGGSSDVQVEGFQPIDVPGGGLVNLADQSNAIIVKAPDLQAGDFVTLDFSFGNGSTEDVDIPVVPACYEWAGLDKSGSAASGSASASSSASSSPTLVATPSASSSASSESSPSASASSSAQCEVPSSSVFPETGESSAAPE